MYFVHEYNLVGVVVAVTAAVSCVCILAATSCKKTLSHSCRTPFVAYIFYFIIFSRIGSCEMSYV